MTNGTTSLPKLTGLFLGAGASCEVGMPLVWELTAELKGWLTPAKLRELNEGWRRQGGGHASEVIEDFAQLLTRDELHYEALLGFLETQFRRRNRPDDDYHGLYVWLVEMVYWMLHARHVKNAAFIKRHVHHLDGIARLADQNHPLWIFSLNHDLIVECLAAEHGIPINSGFSSEIVTLPRRDPLGNKIGELTGEVLTSDNLEKTGMPFLQHGKHCINLLKIHGALDVFAFRSGKDLVKLRPTSPTVEGVLDTLRIANEELLYYEPRSPAKRTRIINEIAYADDSGEMQFLRRTLLAGAYKFDSRASQVVPMRLLDHFRAHLNNVTRLICIGYGFGDLHINRIMQDWLAFVPERHLVIVGPEVRQIPSAFLHLAPQVTLEASVASDFLDRHTGIVRTRREVLEKRFAALLRTRVPLQQRRTIVQVLKRIEPMAKSLRDATARWAESKAKAMNAKPSKR